MLGPILFTLYISPLGDICQAHDITFQSYADDQQNYASFKPVCPKSRDECIIKIQNCISDIRDWMHTNLLKLNDSKTEVIMIGTPQMLKQVNESNVTIKIGTDIIHPVESVHNLGFHMDRYFKNTAHVNKLCSTLYLTLKRIGKIRHLLDQSTLKILMQALLLSRLDYCNGLLLGTADYQLEKLQKLQNMACRLIFGLRKSDQISDKLQSLHWLKIQEWIQYKIAVIVSSAFKAQLLSILGTSSQNGLRT